MAFSLKSVLGAVALVGVTMVATTTVVSQHDEASQEEMWQAYMQLAKPGVQHERLGATVGKWELSSSMWEHPGSEPQHSTSVAKRRSMFGGRFVKEEMKGKFDFGGETHDFEGFGIYGYDNLKEKYIFVWMDNMGTMMMYGEGTPNEAGDVVTYYSEIIDPMTRQPTKMKLVDRKINDDKYIFEMYHSMGEGEWFKHFEAVQMRAK